MEEGDDVLDQSAHLSGILVPKSVIIISGSIVIIKHHHKW